METRTFKIEPANSTIEWVGKKVTGAHNGTLDDWGFAGDQVSEFRKKGITAEKKK